MHASHYHGSDHQRPPKQGLRSVPSLSDQCISLHFSNTTLRQGPVLCLVQESIMLSHRRSDSRISHHCVGTGVPDGPSQIRSIDKTEDSTMIRTTIVPYFILSTSQQKVKKKRPGAHDSETPCRSIQYVKKRTKPKLGSLCSRYLFSRGAMRALPVADTAS